MPIHIVRLGTPRLPGEGLRIGTVRRPPRGVPKSDFASGDWYDVWYPNLAPSLEKSGFAFLDASDADLDEAEELARSIVAEIRAGRFAPAGRLPLWPDDPLGPIWGVGMRSAAAVGVHAGGDE